MAWLTLNIEIDSSDAEHLETLCIAAGALSTTLEDAGDDLLIEHQPGDKPLWRRVRFSAMFDDDGSPALRRLIDSTLLLAGAQVEALADQDWDSAYRDQFRAQCFGQSLWICPTWETPVAEQNVLRMDPGMAFGTGQHATTAMCLDWLARHPPVGKRVLDYGCGSGILGLAAGILGAKSITFVDHDPQALRSTRENADLNAMPLPPDAVCAPGEEGSRVFDLVLANIFLTPIIELRDRFAAFLDAGGEMLLTGLLETQSADVISAYADVCALRVLETRDEWALLHGCME